MTQAFGGPPRRGFLRGAGLLERRAEPVNRAHSAPLSLYFGLSRRSKEAMPNRLHGRIGDAWRLLAHSLSGRLLLLTLLYVMVSEVLIFVPSIGRFYTTQLERHIETAELAILPFTEPTSGEFSAG